MSVITTQILDLSKGKPAEGITVLLFIQSPEDPVTSGWRQIAIGTSNSEGNIPDLLPKEVIIEPGTYRFHFATKEYFEKLATSTLFPYIDIVFTISEGESYHLPLMLSPFGFSTCRA